MKPTVVAIDGPAGAGKSTIAKALAVALGIEYLDTGAMYRGVTFEVLKRGLEATDVEAVSRVARTIHFVQTRDSLHVNGVDATAAIRTAEVDAAVSHVAANSAVREEMRSRQRQWIADHGGGVVEGRDIGSVVFPDATLKVYLVATPLVRAKRRVAQHGGDVEEIARAIAERDERDSTRDDSPLRQMPDAVVVDTSDRSVEQVIAEITEPSRSRERRDNRPLGQGCFVMTKFEARLVGQSMVTRVAYSLVRNLLLVLCKLWFRVSVSGREHLPRSGPYIIAPVHRSNIDTPLSAFVTRRRVRFMGKDSLWKQKQIGAFLSLLGGFPVTRGTADLEALKRCVSVLDAGEPLVMFPEGTRQSGPTLHPLFEGPAYVALKRGVPIVPVGIGGSERVMRKGSKMIWPHKCHVTIGEAISVEHGGSGRVDRERMTQITAELAARLQTVFDDARRRSGD
jgi:cytidylate kinase